LSSSNRIGRYPGALEVGGEYFRKPHIRSSKILPEALGLKNTMVGQR
jgi:hypothetical protein